MRGGKGALRRAYRRFVNDGLGVSLESPWEQAASGLVIGSEQFVDEVRRRLGDRKRDASLPQLEQLRSRPTLDAIVSATAAEFGESAAELSGRLRADDASRAVAAYVARVRCGYSAREVAAALGYSSHGGVVAAVRRYDASRSRLSGIAKRVEKAVTID